MEFSFEKLAKIIEGYFLIMKMIFPQFHELKIEHIESHKDGLMFSISRTIETFLISNPTDTTKRKIGFTITISKNEQIIKGDDIETQPK